jgi:hypothetical protein
MGIFPIGSMETAGQEAGQDRGEGQTDGKVSGQGGQEDREGQENKILLEQGIAQKVMLSQGNG